MVLESFIICIIYTFRRILLKWCTAQIPSLVDLISHGHQFSLLAETSILSINLLVLDVTSSNISIRNLQIGQVIVQLRLSRKCPVVLVDDADQRCIPDCGGGGIPHEAQLSAKDETFSRWEFGVDLILGPAALADRDVGLAAGTFLLGAGDVLTPRTTVPCDYEPG